MEPNDFVNPAHNLNCQMRFNCKAEKCPDSYDQLIDHNCFVDRFKRYQPSSDIWYRRDWEDVNKITWWEMFGLKERWLFIIYIIIIAVLILMVALLAKVLIIYRYY